MITKEKEVCLEIEKALKRHEMKVYYQPKFDAATSQMTGAEALVRWHRPDGSIVMPGDFIPALEKTTMILELDKYVLKEVCIFLNKQKQDNVPSVPISVNFSRVHLLEDNFVEQLCEITEMYGIPHNMIEVELTESAMVECFNSIVEFVKDIRDAGFDVAIDDFGSGLSSLSLVKDIPANILKIDKALLSKNCEDEKERIVLESIFEFANRLQFKTVAEGVETKEQLGFFRTCGCKTIQGFLFSKPIPEQDFWEMCKEHNPISEEDILATQAPMNAIQLLLEAVFIRFPLVIFSNLSRNSYYMMAYENFTARSCASTGIYEELIEQGSLTMAPEDRELFRNTFTISGQIKAFQEGEKFIRVITRQLGDDGVYRRVETTNYFVQNPAVDDVLVVTLCQNLD